MFIFSGDFCSQFYNVRKTPTIYSNVYRLWFCRFPTHLYWLDYSNNVYSDSIEYSKYNIHYALMYF